jgi:energy-coupling factor transporter transmembrane protein EcfT
MLPLNRLLISMALYVLLLLWARLLSRAARQVWQLKWLLVALFAVDWLVVGLDLAIVVTLRVVLLAGVFTLIVSTTTPDELRLALEALRVPYRYAFSLGLAFQSMSLLQEEWRAIREAQASRGASTLRRPSVRSLAFRVGDLVSLTVPAIVLTTRRAWSMTEAAYARGFDGPHRRPYRQLSLRWSDGAWMVLTITVVALLLLW